VSRLVSVLILALGSAFALHLPAFLQTTIRSSNLSELLHRSSRFPPSHLFFFATLEKRRSPEMGLFSRRNDATYDDNYNPNGSNRYGNSDIVNNGNAGHGINQGNNDMPITQNSNVLNDGSNTHGFGHHNHGVGSNNTFGNDTTNTHQGLGHTNQSGGQNSAFGNDGTTHTIGGRNDIYNSNYNNRNTRRSGGGDFFNSMKGHHQRSGTQRGRHTNRQEKYLSHHQPSKQKRALFDMDSGYYNRRPSFGQWLKFTWLDLLTMACMGAIGLGIYNAHPAPTRSFPITFLSGEVVYPEFAYPLRKNIIPIWAAALLASLIPIFIILCMQIRVRSFWDANNAIIGLLYSLIGAAVFQVFVKWLIGGLRPHFLAVCDPDPSVLGTGFRAIMFDRKVCRGKTSDIDDSLESMPSGHSTAAWAGFLYLYFYLNAKLKVFSNHHPAFWKLIVLYAPLLGATLITGSLTIDEFHNWYDCLAGAVIGSVFAISAYRMLYASVWDFRFNHIPLTRHTPFSYGAGPAGAGGFESAVFTRKAGWGFEEAYGGAPFDAAHGLRGQAVGFNQGVPGRHGGAGIMGNKLDNDIENNAGAGVGGNLSGYENRHGHWRGHGNGRHENDGYDAATGTHVNNMLTSGVDGGGGGGGGGGLTSHGHMLGALPINTNVRNDGLQRNDGLDTRNEGTGLNTNTRNEGVTTNRDSVYANEPTTPTRTGDGRYHHHSRSLERKQVPAVPAAQTGTGALGGREREY
jgi:diacylglycerol diphosphate phosphatase/phosphatidate phosphatase